VNGFGHSSSGRPTFYLLCCIFSLGLDLKAQSFGLGFKILASFSRLTSLLLSELKFRRCHKTVVQFARDVQHKKWAYVLYITHVISRFTSAVYLHSHLRLAVSPTLIQRFGMQSTIVSVLCTADLSIRVPTLYLGLNSC